MAYLVYYNTKNSLASSAFTAGPHTKKMIKLIKRLTNQLEFCQLELNL